MNREQLKQEYLQSESTTLRSLAQKHALNYNTLKGISAKEGWAKEKKQHLAQLRQTLEAHSAQLQEQASLDPFSQKEKINRIAENLLASIEQGTQVFEKPAHIATLTGALKELTAILRDVNETPNQTQRRKYELAKQKLDIESAKIGTQAGKESGNGVVMLPEVAALEER